MRYFFTLFVLITICFYSFTAQCADKNKMPDDFVDISSVSPSVILDIRYFTQHNFVGERLAGYNAPKCILTKKAAEALAKVQDELQKFNMSLKIYDCYRPQRAVDRFVEWAKDVSDVKMKDEFYPTVDKKNLFKDGYIAAKSGHSRGSAVDVTVVEIPIKAQPEFKTGEKLRACTLPASKRFKDNALDFGTGYDCFDKLSHPTNEDIGVDQRSKRLMLRTLMEKFGFDGIDEEWWHFKLRDEPYPKTYFDFIIE